MTRFSPPFRTTVLLVIGALSLQAGVLWWFGQPLLCECGYVKVWEGAVKSSGNSQHLTDWYTPSHLLHGIIFFGILMWLLPRRMKAWAFPLALSVEVGWELLENTPAVIEHYRKQALAQGYVGDSILNSLMDTVAMVVGYFMAARVPAWISLAVVIGFEAFTVYMIRDGLFLNTINLIYPLDGIAEWQSRGGAR